MRARISAVRAAPIAVALSDSDPIVLDKARIAPAHTEPISRVGESRWDLVPLLHKPTVAGSRSINFDTFPLSFRSAAKRLVWLCLNVPTPMEDLERPTATRSQLSVGSIVVYAGFLRLWMAWLDKQGIHRLDSVTDDVYRRYCSEVAASGLGRESQANRLFAITRCWLYGPYLPDSDTLIRPYWENALTRADVLGDAKWSAENRTPPIHPQTMSALLVWAIRFCTDFSADILAATRTKSNPPHRPHLDGLTPSERFDNYAQQQGTSSKRIPGFYPTNRPDQRCIAKQFIGWQLGLGTDDVLHLGSMDRVFGDLDPVDEAVLPVSITGTIDTRPWTGGINFYDVDNLSRLLATAAFIVVAYLTGMRGEECRALRHGCCRTTLEEKTGQTRHLIYGHVFKNALDESGNALPAGSERDHPWQAIAPVAKAIEVMEALHPDSDLVFPLRAYTPLRNADGDKAVHPRMIRDRTADLISWCNAKAEKFDRPHESIPADPDGPVVVKRFRRTLAWFIYRQPGGRIALGIQYGHLRGHSTDGYGSRVASGLRDVFPMEEALAAAEYLEAAAARLDDGESVTGPAAQRYRDGVRLYHRQFGGRYLTNRQAAALNANPRLRIYDNSEQFVTCCYDQSKALCHPDRNKSVGVEASPDITNCQPNCGNIARTDRNIADVEAAIEQTRDEIASTTIPLPLKVRLEQRIDNLQRVIDHHRHAEGRR
ncbi:MAG: hypothetical protein WAX14_06970 [Rhodococcus sp. (in: high G+C Gram-positive bacteria)]|uniref:hypothetical protein n=1 Tax=Rhodococcus sp. TaxID=1831 RepID=UPI003BB644EE